ncbi:hypothetical protein ACHAPE_004041 [Trichoderma viride]
MSRRPHAQEGGKTRTATAGQRTVCPQEDRQLTAAGARIPRDRGTRPSDHPLGYLQPGTDTISPETDIYAPRCRLLKFKRRRVEKTEALISKAQAIKESQSQPLDAEARAPSVEYLGTLEGASKMRYRGNPAPTPTPLPARRPFGISRRDHTAIYGILDPLKEIGEAEDVLLRRLSSTATPAFIIWKKRKPRLVVDLRE